MAITGIYSSSTVFPLKSVKPSIVSLCSPQPLEKLTKMSNNSQSMSFQAGEAKGQAQEKASGMMDRAADAAQSAKESMQETGQQMMSKAQGVADAAKDAVNK